MICSRPRPRRCARSTARWMASRRGRTFPRWSSTFCCATAAGDQRHTNVLRAEAGYVSLAEVLRAYPSGLAPADAAWMFNRMLTALGIAHSLGIVHGAVRAGACAGAPGRPQRHADRLVLQRAGRRAAEGDQPAICGRLPARGSRQAAGHTRHRPVHGRALHGAAAGRPPGHAGAAQKRAASPSARC